MHKIVSAIPFILATLAVSTSVTASTIHPQAEKPISNTPAKAILLEGSQIHNHQKDHKSEKERITAAILEGEKQHKLAKKKSEEEQTKLRQEEIIMREYGKPAKYNFDLRKQPPSVQINGKAQTQY